MSKSICVFCGARMGNNPAFEQAARDLGDILAKNTWRLVYGAGDIGLMGTVANSAQAAGSTTFGVIPEHLMQVEVGKRDVDRFHYHRRYAQPQEIDVHQQRCSGVAARWCGLIGRIF
jgi:uncharacterized protein (TIGR00730 family)